MIQIFGRDNQKVCNFAAKNYKSIENIAEMKHRLLLIFTLMCGVLFGAKAQDKAVSEDISVDGTKRNMLVYAPADLPENAPLLISLHGMNQDAAYQQKQSDWPFMGYW